MALWTQHVELPMQGHIFSILWNISVSVWLNQLYYLLTCISQLTLNSEEGGSFEIFCITGIHPWIIKCTVMNNESSLSAISHNVALLSFTDFLSVSEPPNFSIFSGDFTLQNGSGLLLNSLILQRFGELNWWLCTVKPKKDWVLHKTAYTVCVRNITNELLQLL